MSIRNFQDCLGTKNTQWCLPVEKPNLCLQESWMRLQSKFEGEPCSNLEVSITNEDGKAQLIMIVKGQLISKAIYGFLNFPIKRTSG